MKNALVCTVLGTGILGFSTIVDASVIDLGPMVQVEVTTGDVREVFEVKLIEGDKGWAFDQSFEADEFEISLDGDLNPDPSIAYGIAVVDFGAPSIFGFSFFTPIVPTGLPTTVSASVAGGLTDFTGDGVSLTPTGASLQSSSVFFPMTSMGVDVGPAFAAGPGPAGAVHTYGPHAAGPTAGPSGLWTGLGVSTSFALSGGGDVAALTGFASVETRSAVPEYGPGVAGAIAIGLILVAGTIRRRRLAFG